MFFIYKRIFSFSSLPFFILRLYIFSGVSKAFNLTFWIMLIVPSQSLPGNFNIYVISELLSVVFFFFPPLQDVKISCAVIGGEAMDYICVLLDTMCLRGLLTMLLFLFQQAIDCVMFSSQVPPHLRALVLMSGQFSEFTVLFRSFASDHSMASLGPEWWSVIQLSSQTIWCVGQMGTCTDQG